jgi:hypothetical protein
MAHEVAHLLIGEPTHNHWGIMRPAWNRADLMEMSRLWLVFAREDRDRMRVAAAELRLRVARARALATESMGQR